MVGHGGLAHTRIKLTTAKLVGFEKNLDDFKACRVTQRGQNGREGGGF
jgi:hypothetical protein